MKLGRRLQQISDLIQHPYAHIWDCCCDHGLLGMQLLQRKIAGKVHFVDIVPELMQQVEQRLQRHLPSELKTAWQVHCLDVAKIPLAAHSDQGSLREHLVIIAGVGGDLLIELVEEISLRHPDQPLEFILCPVHHQNKVRAALSQLSFGLISETLVEENGRYYEILHVARYDTHPITLIGSQMWDLARDQDQHYLRKTIEHYQRKKLLSSLEQEALSQYRLLEMTR